MFGRMGMIGVLIVALVGCATTEALTDSSGTTMAAEASSNGSNSRSSASASVTTTDANPGAADGVSGDSGSSDAAGIADQDSTETSLANADPTAESAGSSPDLAAGFDRAPVLIDPSGLPLEEVMIPREGLRLVFDVTTSQTGVGDAAPRTAPDTQGNGDAPTTDSPAVGSPRGEPGSSEASVPDESHAGLEGSLPNELTLILQPSRTARADISVHAPGAEGYLVMEETETLWQPALVVGDHPLTQALAEFAYPRYLPPDRQSFRSAAAADEFFITGVGERAWQLVYDSGTMVRIGNFLIEPMALDGGGPETIVVTPSSSWPVRLTLRSAAVYREREISGAVVSAFGRPLSDVTVAPHPQVGRLPASRVAVTDAFGVFMLPYRAAPGDSIRLYYGRTTGSGAEARIANPQEIRGRVDSPDFATLIFTEQ